MAIIASPYQMTGWNGLDDLVDPVSTRGLVCADCRFAQVYAVQEQVRCHNPVSSLNGHSHLAAALPCPEFTPGTRDLDLCAYRRP